MKKEFIPYNEALALKELGFDEPFFGYYVELRNPQEGILVIDKCENGIDGVLAPTFSQAFRWFREKHQIDSVIIRSFSMTISYYYNIVIDRDYGNDLQSISIPNRTYEEAELECLKKLISIVKNK